MRSVCGIFAIGLLVAAPCKGGEVSFQSLKIMLSSQNPNMAQAVSRVRKAEAAKDASRWAFSPSLSYTANKKWTRSSSQDPWGSAAVAHVLSLDYTVFDGFSRWRAMDSADLGVEKQSFDLTVNKATVFSTLATSYLEWQAAIARIRILEEIEGIRRKNTNDVSSRAQRGELDQQEILIFKNQLLDAQDRLIQAKAARDAATISFSTVLPMLRLQAEQDRPVEEALFAQDYCTEMNHRIEQHPRIESLRRTEGLATLAKKDATASLMPAVTLGADHQMNSWTAANDDPNATTLSLGVRWTLFDGLSSMYDRRQAVFAEQEAKHAVEASLAELQSTVRQNCQRLESLAQRIETGAQLIANEKTIYEQGERSYRLSGISALDLIKLQTDYLNAQLQLVQLKLDQQKLRLSQTIVYDPVGLPTQH